MDDVAKLKVLKLIQDIDIEAMLIPKEADRNWFKFGAYSAIKIMVEKVSEL